MKKLLILGAGQHGKVVKEIAELMDCYDKIDFLDDSSEIAIGKILDYKNFIDSYDEYFVAIGNNEFRIQMINQLLQNNIKIATIVHPSSVISDSVKISYGTVVEAGAIINTESIIEEGCIISLGAIVDHNCTVEKGAHLRVGTLVGPRAIVKEKYESKLGEIINEV